MSSKILLSAINKEFQSSLNRCCARLFSDLPNHQNVHNVPSRDVDSQSNMPSYSVASHCVSNEIDEDIPELVNEVKYISNVNLNSRSFSSMKVPKQDVQSADKQLESDSHPKIDLRFSNSREAYKSKTTLELLRSLVVFQICSISFIVEKNQQLMKIARKILGRRLFHLSMRMTFYGQFVGGESHDDIVPVIVKNRRFGVKSILDYSAEKDLSKEEAKTVAMQAVQPEEQPSDDPIHRHYTPHRMFGDRRDKVVSARTYFYVGEKECDRNMDIFINCIDSVSETTNGSGFAAIKLTALGRPQLLLQLSEVLVQMRTFFERFSNKDSSSLLDYIKNEDMEGALNALGVPAARNENRNWFTVLDLSKNVYKDKHKKSERIQYAREIDLLDWDNLLSINTSLSKLFVVPNIKTGKWEPMMKCLSDNEEDQMRNMLKRINTIAQHASRNNVRVMVDAEQTYFQPAISRLTMEMMRKFNKKRNVIFNTYQAYLKQAYNNLIIDLDLARRESFYFGAKIVRGAYMEQERERAATLNYEDPINESYEATTAMYQNMMEEAMRQIKSSPPHRIAVMVASHNADTVRTTVEQMKKHGITPNDRVICFGQLLGMCDQITFPLGQAGYSVYKYVPYGPIDEVLPYLSRRARENKGVLKKVKKEKQLMRNELLRRLFSGVWWYNPEKHAPFKTKV